MKTLFKAGEVVTLAFGYAAMMEAGAMVALGYTGHGIVWIVVGFVAAGAGHILINISHNIGQEAFWMP